MTRLKYYNDGELLTTDWFTIGPNLVVRGTINTKTFQYTIKQFDSQQVMSSTAKNLRDAKDKLKKELIKSGVIFDGEIRKH